MRLKIALKNRKIDLRRPSNQYRKKVIERASEIGDAHLLSDTDIDLLAIALELKEQGYDPKIVTDDYSIQNVASRLTINFVSLTTSGITLVFKWRRYCPGCYKKYNSNQKLNFCLICGTKLKRKPEKAKSISK